MKSLKIYKTSIKCNIFDFHFLVDSLQESNLDNWIQLYRCHHHWLHMVDQTSTKPNQNLLQEHQMIFLAMMGPLLVLFPHQNMRTRMIQRRLQNKNLNSELYRQSKNLMKKKQNKMKTQKKRKNQHLIWSQKRMTYCQCHYLLSRKKRMRKK